MPEFGVWNEIRLNLLVLAATAVTLLLLSLVCRAITRDSPERREV